MKLLTTALLLLCSIPLYAQGFSINTPNGSISINGRDVEITLHQIAQQHNADGEIVIMSEDEFNTACEKQKIDIKSQNVWSVFWLPPRSQQFVLYIKKGTVNAKHVLTIRNYIDNVIYTRTWEVVSRQGYSEVTFRVDNHGNSYYRRRNDWVSGLDGLVLLPYGGFIMYNGPTGFNPRLGEMPSRQTTTKERIATTSDVYIYLADPVKKDPPKTDDKKAPPPPKSDK